MVIEDGDEIGEGDAIPGQDRPFSAAQEQACVHLASGRSRRKVAEKAGISARTVNRWMADPAFAAFVAETRSRLVADACGRLSGAASAAAAELRKLIKSPDESIRLRASVSLLDMLVKMRSHVELDARIIELERIASANEGQGRPEGRRA